jgi:subtilisin family serine protease
MKRLIGLFMILLLLVMPALHAPEAVAGSRKPSPTSVARAKSRANSNQRRVALRPGTNARGVLRAKGRAIPNRYIVALRAGSNPRAIAAIAGVSPRYVYTSALNGFAAALTTGQLNTILRQGNVLAVEQDQVVRIDMTETMDANGNPWGLDRIDQRSLPLSRTYTNTGNGQGVRAYIIDTGIQTSHPDFGGRASAVYDAFGGNGQDCNGHGAHVAGTVGGATYGLAKGVVSARYACSTALARVRSRT